MGRARSRRKKKESRVKCHVRIGLTQFACCPLVCWEVFFYLFFSGAAGAGPWPLGGACHSLLSGKPALPPCRPVVSGQ